MRGTVVANLPYTRPILLAVVSFFAHTAFTAEAEGRLQQAGGAVHRSSADSQLGSQSSDKSDSFLGVLVGGLSITSTAGLTAAALDGQPSTATSGDADQSSASRSVAIALSTDVGRTDAELWRWGVASDVRGHFIMAAARVDTWYEQLASGERDQASLLTLGPGMHAALGPGHDLSVVALGASWHDDDGWAYGLGVRATVSAQWTTWLVSQVDGEIGRVGSATWHRVSAGVGPSWQGLQLMAGYADIAVGGVDLGGPMLSAGYIW